MTRVFKQKNTTGTIRMAGFAAVVVVLVALVYIGLGNLGATQTEKQIEIAKDAIIKAAVQCYALESQFPPSLQYLADNYGLSLDEEKYIYHYQTIGSNMVPEIQVFPKVTQR